MDPTATQLAARLNPIAKTIQSPTGGLFYRDGTLYKVDGTTLSRFDVSNLIPMEERASIGNWGAQLGTGIQRLKDQYGIDVSTLPEATTDILSQLERTQGFRQVDLKDPTSFLGQPLGTTTSTQINTQPNVLSPQAVLNQQAGQPQPQSFSVTDPNRIINQTTGQTAGQTTANAATPQLSNAEIATQVARAKAMLAQTAAQGAVPFAGSSYERALTTGTQSTTASDTLKALGIDASSLGTNLTPESILSQVSQNPAYKLYMEALSNKTRNDTASAEAQKQKLATQMEADKKTLENNLAQSGLAFSGIRSEDVKSLVDNLASSTLSIDRETAAKLLDADVNARSKFLDIATDVIKAASDESSKQYDKAVAQLNKLGFAVIGNELVPIPKNQPASYDEWVAVGSPGTYANWLNRPTRSQINTTTETTKSGGLIYTGKMAQEDNTILENSRGTDGYVDPTVYLELYSEWIKAGGLLKDFLSTYPPRNYVNPANTWLPPFLMPTSPTNPY